jgi:DNA-binding HxlR family transcriptional regulator
MSVRRSTWSIYDTIGSSDDVEKSSINSPSVMELIQNATDRITMRDNTDDADVERSPSELLVTGVDQHSTASASPKCVTDGGSESEEVMSLSETGDQQALNVITQRTRWNLVQYIIAHPVGMPTLTELAYMYPNKDKSTLHEHLKTLVESGLVERVELPRKNRNPDDPRTFYRLTEKGSSLIDDHNLIRADKEMLRAAYSKVPKTEKIERYEQATRPDPPADGPSDEYVESVETMLSKSDGSDEEERVAKLAQLAEKSHYDPSGKNDDEGTVSSDGVLSTAITALKSTIALLEHLKSSKSDSSNDDNDNDDEVKEKNKIIA